MKCLVLLTILSCFLLIANAQPGGTRISMGEAPGINLTASELKGAVKEIIESEYHGKLNESNIDTSKAASKTLMKFDQKGNEIEELRYGRSGKLLSRCTYDYANPKFVLVKKYIQDTVLLGKYIYADNDSGKVVRLDIIPGKYAAGFRTLYRYNNKGFIAGESTGVASKDTMFVIGRTIFEYNENGRKILRKAYDHGGNLIDSTSFSYDALNNITEISMMNMSGMMHSKSLIKRTKIDKYGNWRLTVSEENSDGLLGNMLTKYIIKRTILYY